MTNYKNNEEKKAFGNPLGTKPKISKKTIDKTALYADLSDMYAITRDLVKNMSKNDQEHTGKLCVY